MSRHSLLLEETAKHIQTLQGRKSKLLREVHEIDQELWDAQARHAKLVNLTAPVSKLPNELLVEIFQTCQGERVWGGSRTRTPFEVIASHVSTHWRGIALGTPLLWNDIHITVTPRTNVFDRAMHRLTAYLTRSDPSLVDILLQIMVPEKVPGFLHELTPHAIRWHRVSISISPGCSPNDIYGPLRNVAAPALMHLSLHAEVSDGRVDPRNEYPDHCPPILTGGSPSLSFVRVSGVVVGNLIPPLRAVTTLDIDARPKMLMSLSQFQDMLSQPLQLVNLSLTGLNIQLLRDPLNLSHPSPLPALRSLRIRGTATPCHRLLSFMSLPNLENLSLHAIHAFDSAVIPSLRSLTLDGCMLADGDLQNIIRAFPNVSALSVDEAIPAIFDLLKPNPSPVWPGLRTLTLRDLPPTDVLPLNVMVYSRLNSDAPLHKMFVDRRSRASLRLKNSYNPLSEVVPLVRCDDLAPWPLDLGYEDPDDIYHY
ncbi:hypothetical protein Hypma_006476 [Hypsizygus marmoreus]|uniref:Uncharacterized protein n=1 Tax=Hypsizygus marmoreus TaxID=39966 RepID=A0A369JYT3_HYPMA|nr:hypothetical protein Hypma_006476 [Hypsizygus marmoreus]